MKRFGDKKVLTGLDLLLSPGVRLGAVGLNGSGKTTLLRLLAKQLQPDHGSVIHAPDLTVAYFEQGRAGLEPHWQLKRALCEAGDTVVFQGQPLHVSAWARRFQFRPDQLDTPVAELSGGEQARLAIARLMLRPVDVLLLDEPTNDLDIPALEALEETLLSFSGALVMVTHDRYLLSRVCDTFLGLGGEGPPRLYADYEQWEAALRGARAKPEKRAKEKSSRRGSGAPAPGRLSYLEQREYAAIEAQIEAAESRREACRRTLEDPLIAADSGRLTAAAADWRQAEAEVERLYARWAELEEKRGLK